MISIVADGSLQDIVFRLVQTIEAEGGIIELVEAARKEAPKNSELKDFEEKIKQKTGAGQSTTHKAWKIPFEENPNFTGRKELLENLENNLNKGESTALTQAIHGLGGIGKTQLAVKYTYEYQEKYKVIWWLRAEEETTLASDYGDLALTLGLTTSTDTTEQIKAVKDWLEAHNKWLLVFDNAPEPKAIHNYVPTKRMGHVIITSRHHDWSATTIPLEVNAWNQEESLNYLKKRLNFSKEQKDKAKELTKELGNLPLALAQAAGYIVETQIDVETYLQIFKTKRRELWENEEAPLHYIEKQVGKN